MNDKLKSIQSFYDEYWPLNIPDSTRAREYVISILPTGNYKRILDAGCGTGVITLVLAEKANEVKAVDISNQSLNIAAELAHKAGKHNIEFIQASVLDLPFENEHFDLVFSWGVIHHTHSPFKALHELIRVLAPGGILVLAVYRKTKLTIIHEVIRKLCIKLPNFLKKPVVELFSITVTLIIKLQGLSGLRQDNVSIESKVEDWFFVPEKHYFTLQEIKVFFEQYSLKFNLVQEKTGVFKSSSNFVAWGLKP